MRSDVQIIPAVLATTEEEYKQKIDKLTSCPELTEGWVQIDLMDNKFVPNKSIGLDVVAKYPINLKKEAHLMVINPLDWVDDLKRLGFIRIIFHLESGNPEPVIKHIRKTTLEIGLAINPVTTVEKLNPFVDRIDLVLIMGVHPGFSGQQFIAETVDRVKETSQLRSKNNNLIIEVDGGVGKHVRELVDAGAKNLVMGSYLLDGDVTKNLETIWEAIKS